jgi:hypothetical protein
MTDGAAVEVATVGNEGMVGLPVFLGPNQVLGRAFSQIPGPALRLRASAFRNAAAAGKLHELMQLYTQALFTQISQSAACNRLHLIAGTRARASVPEGASEQSAVVSQSFEHVERVPSSSRPGGS